MALSLLVSGSRDTFGSIGLRPTVEAQRCYG